MKKKPSEVMTIGDLSTYLKISKSTLYKLAQEDSLPGIKVGKHWRFHKDNIDSWLKHSNKLAKGKHGKKKI